MFSGNLHFGSLLENARVSAKTTLFVQALHEVDKCSFFYIEEWLPLLAVSKEFIADDTFVQEIRAALHSIRHHHHDMLDATFDHNMQIYDEIVQCVWFWDFVQHLPSGIDIPEEYIGPTGEIRPFPTCDDTFSDSSETLHALAIASLDS